MRLWVRSLASLSGLQIWRCCELWYKLQTWLGSCVAVAVAMAVAMATAVAPVCPLAWEPPYAVSAALKSKKKKRTQKSLIHVWLKKKVFIKRQNKQVIIETLTINCIMSLYLLESQETV